MNNHQYGVTPPISLKPPTEQDLQLSIDLNLTLQKHGLFESEDEAKKREIVLGKLNMLVREFVKTVLLQSSYPESIANEAGGKIFTFGSYRLGVHGAGADIDTLCIVPQNVERSHFFTIFYDMLKAHAEVTFITAVPDAYVPVIKMHFDGIPIDLVFANIALPVVKDDLDLLDNNLLRNIDDKSILSLNGSRVADQIVRLVPNIPTFHSALRCIKLWAKKRAIYSNAVGYLGGVAWALLVARICQLYPNAAPSLIVTRFFSIYQQWIWPNPVMLRHIEDGPLPVWNPKTNPADRIHKMPVITPAYPSMCATHNVSSSTLCVLTAEFERGVKITLDIVSGKAVWEDLFLKSDFFERYKNYFRIVVASTDAENQRLWVGLVESRIRMLVMKLEMVPGLEIAPPYPYGFEATVTGTSLEEIIDRKTDSSKNDDSLEVKTYYTTSYYIGLQLQLPPKNDDSPSGPRRLYVEKPVTDFKRMLQSWEKYSPDMEIYIRNTKRADLPDEVFEGGISDCNSFSFVGVRPQRVKRQRKVDPGASAAAKKLGTNIAPMNVDSPSSTVDVIEKLKEDNAVEGLKIEAITVNSTNGIAINENQAELEELKSLHSKASLVAPIKKPEIKLKLAK